MASNFTNTNMKFIQPNLMCGLDQNRQIICSQPAKQNMQQYYYPLPQENQPAINMQPGISLSPLNQSIYNAEFPHSQKTKTNGNGTTTTNKWTRNLDKNVKSQKQTKLNEYWLNNKTETSNRLSCLENEDDMPIDKDDNSTNTPRPYSSQEFKTSNHLYVC